MKTDLFIQRELKGIFSKITDEQIPDSYRGWLHTGGGVIVLLMLMQFITGILLLFYYSPDAPYESTKIITVSIPFGWWVRSLHRWTSNFLVIMLFLHTFRTALTSDFLKKGALRWFSGVALFFLLLGACFTGYTLVGDERSFWAGIVGINIAGEIPILGKLIKGFFLDISGAPLLNKFSAIHFWVIPGFLLVLGALHILSVRATGATASGENESNHPFFPDHTIDVLLVFLFITVVIIVFTYSFPTDPGNPPGRTPPSVIKPEWYFFGIYFTLRYLPLYIALSLWTIVFVYFFFFPLFNNFSKKGFLRGIIRLSVPLGISLYLAFILFEAILD